MPRHVQAPVHDPRDYADSISPSAHLQAQFEEYVRNFDVDLVQRIRQGQISRHELAQSDKLCQAVDLYHRIAIQQTPFRTRRTGAS